MRKAHFKKPMPPVVKKPDKQGSARPARSLKEETKSNILKVAQVEKDEKRKRTFGEKLSSAIAAFCGSMTFVYVHIAWFGGWVAINGFFPSLAFDEFPFTFLTLVVSLEAIFLSTFILISQNHETKLAERRNQLDLQINMLAEQENTKQIELLEAIARKVGVDMDDPELSLLKERVDPYELAKQIASINGSN
ncbi:MAG: DUF1003 domain-containing protein [Pyrinomonadaceae bacterium]